MEFDLSGHKKRHVSDGRYGYRLSLLMMKIVQNRRQAVESSRELSITDGRTLQSYRYLYYLMGV